MAFRRAVTGHDSNGKSIFASDEQVGTKGLGMTALWAADETLTFPDDGAIPAWAGLFPPIGGFRFGVAQFPAGHDAKQHPHPVVHERRHVEETPGMHWTDTIDLEVVLSGELTLELDGGEEKTFRAGDTIIQNGTNHRWRNDGDETAVFIVFMVGTNRK
jgi:mannose-6-phosphate isomerase-like protein (cupin superfamily)